MMTALELRPATSTDESFVHDLMLRTLEEELSAWAWPQPMRSQLLDVQYRGRLAGIRSAWPDSLEQIVLLAGQPVGRMVVAHTSDEIRILDIALLPERRNAGIGAAAIGKIIEEANRTGRPICLSVNISNRAQQLYKRLGFTSVSCSEVQLHMEWRPSLTPAAI